MPKTQPESLNSPTRSQFNPAGSKNINNFKQKTDELIHAIVKIIADPEAPAEAKRCAAVARTNYEQACMWAVKAVAILEDSIAQKANLADSVARELAAGGQSRNPVQEEEDEI